MNGIEELSREDLIKVCMRDRFVKEQLAARVANLVHENLELMGLLQEAQQDLQHARAANNGDAPTPEPVVDVTS